MILKITLTGLKDYQKELLYADLGYFKASIKKNLIEEVEKYGSDRNLLFKLAKISSKINPLVDISQIQQVLQAYTKINYVDYSIKEYEKKLEITLEINDLIFELQKYTGLLKNVFGLDKKQFINKLIKEINEEYHTKPIIEVIQE